MPIPIYRYIFLITLLFGNVFSYRYAVIIGHNGAGGKLGQLKYAENDAKALSKVLEQHGGFNSKNIQLLLSPTPAIIDKALDSLTSLLSNKQSSDPTLAVIYYSGHADEKSLLLGNQSYALDRIKNALDHLPSGVRIGIFDACHSGVLARSKGASWGMPFYLQEGTKVKGQVLIASSSADEQSQESDNLKSSVFSHHWTTGLLGNADVSQDRRITLNEAYQYAYQKTMETSALTHGGIQHPSFQFNLVGEGDVVLTDLTNSKGGVEFTAPMDGRFLLLSQDYSRVLGDFFKKQGKPTYIALNPGMYTAVQIQGTQTKFFPFKIRGEQTTQLNSALFMLNPVTVARAKGKSLFGTHQYSDSAQNGSPVQNEVDVFNPVQPWSWGLGIGSYLSISKELSATIPRMLGFRIYAEYALAQNVNLQLSALSILPGKNLGLLVGMEYHPQAINSIRLGGALGFSSLVKTDFWTDFGPAIETWAGFSFPLGNTKDVSVRLPYRIIMNESFDQSVGLEILMHFGSEWNYVHRL